MMNIPTSWRELDAYTDILVGRKQLMGSLAMWAVRQSPYPCPDNLHIVLQKLGTMWQQGVNDEYVTIPNMPSLQNWLMVRLERMPEFLAWNERKNGDQSQFAFTSRHDGKKDPDADFIDLDALVRNVAMEVWLESVCIKLKGEDFDRRWAEHQATGKPMEA